MLLLHRLIARHLLVSGSHLRYGLSYRDVEGLLAVRTLAERAGPSVWSCGSRFGRVVEDSVQGYVEGSSDLECNFERGGILAPFDGIHGLSRDADAVAEFCLTHATRRPQVSDPVGDLGRLGHCYALRR